MKIQFPKKIPCSGGSPYQSVFPEVRNRNQTESGLVVCGPNIDVNYLPINDCVLDENRDKFNLPLF